MYDCDCSALLLYVYGLMMCKLWRSIGVLGSFLAPEIAEFAVHRWLAGQMIPKILLHPRPGQKLIRSLPPVVKCCLFPGLASNRDVYR